jgi:hypothetical protein
VPTPMLLNNAMSQGLYTRPLKSRRTGGMRPTRSNVRRCSGVTPRAWAASPICTASSIGEQTTSRPRSYLNRFFRRACLRFLDQGS